MMNDGLQQSTHFFLNLLAKAISCSSGHYISQLQSSKVNVLKMPITLRTTWN